MNKSLMDELEKLDAGERIKLALNLLESVLDSPASVPVTEWQKREIQRRLDDYRTNPNQPMATLADIRRDLGLS